MEAGNALKVRDLQDVLSEQRTQFVVAPFENVQIHGGNSLRVGDRELLLDEKGLSAFGAYLGIPNGYLNKLEDPDLVDRNVRHFLEVNEEAQVAIETDGQHVLGAFDGDEEIIPRDRMANVVSTVFNEDDDVRDVNLDRGYFRVDVTTERLNTEARVGDVTEGGVRFVAHIAPKTIPNFRPYTAEYLFRLDCTNGMTHSEERNKVRLRGSTVDDIIGEMEVHARRLLDQTIPARLEQWASLVEHEVENPEQWVHRVAREAGVSARVESLIIDQLPSLESRSMYDLTNLVTAMQHESVSGVQRLRLQEAGGHVIATSDGVRCTNCQNPLST